MERAKLSNKEETAISKIAGEDEVNRFFDAEGKFHRKFVPEEQKVNAELHVVVLHRLLKRNGKS